MTKPQALQILQLLSALETALRYTAGKPYELPEYITNELNEAASVLTREVLQ